MSDVIQSLTFCRLCHFFEKDIILLHEYYFPRENITQKG